MLLYLPNKGNIEATIFYVQCTALNQKLAPPKKELKKYRISFLRYGLKVVILMKLQKNMKETDEKLAISTKEQESIKKKIK